MGKFIGWERPFEIKALQFVACVQTQVIGLFFGFNSLGNDRQAQRFAHRNDGVVQAFPVDQADGSASLLHDRFLRLLAQGGDSLDWAAIGGLASEDAGREQSRLAE